jgi:hypothetical protein
MLEQMGFKDKNGIVTADTAKKRPNELVPSIEEERIACVICKDGKKFKSNETMGYILWNFFFIPLNHHISFIYFLNKLECMF